MSCLFIMNRYELAKIEVLFLLQSNKKRRRPGEICHVCNYDEQGCRQGLKVAAHHVPLRQMIHITRDIKWDSEKR